MTNAPAISLNDSYAYCHELMRTAARNFYFGMSMLPEAKRQAMHALYGFMRLIDDIADAPSGDSDKRALLENWRADMHAATIGRFANHPIWPAFADTVRRFSIPTKIFDDAIDGQIQDLVQDTYATFKDLYLYCYRVASTVGIAAVHIWGYRDDSALKLAEERGVAMQLTNILRDIREDAARGRTYLPTEDRRQFGCEIWDPTRDPAPEGFEDLLRFESNRAREYYERSAALDDLITPDARPTLQIMTDIYRGILVRIAAHARVVLRRRVGLSTFE